MRKRRPQKAQRALWRVSLLEPEAEPFGKTQTDPRRAKPRLLQPCHPSPELLFAHVTFSVGIRIKKRRKSQFMLSSASLSPHLCQSPDKSSHYFKTPADVCLSFVMNSRATAIGVALLIGAPTVPASERLLFVAPERFFFQQVCFARRHARLHAAGSRWLWKTRPGSGGRFLSAVSSGSLLSIPSRGAGEEAGVGEVSH